jgi:hypothetical protein
MKKFVLSFFATALTLSIHAQSYNVNTEAGTGVPGLADGPRLTTAKLNLPYGLAYDGDSVIYFSDGQNHCIRKISTVTNNVTTIAGSLSGTSGLVNGIGSAARFYWPDDVFYKNGFLYVGDNMNNCIRKIDLSNKMVTTVAGNGSGGYQDGPAGSAMFQGGNGIALAVANNGDIFVADGGNAVVRKISGGNVTTVAGTPGTFGYLDGAASTAQFHRPRYLALDTITGALYITDINNNVIRKLYNNQVTTFAGTGVAGATDGAYNVATFSAPVGIAITIGGYFYVIDGGGNKLRKISPTGTVSTIAGNGMFGFADGAASVAEFNYPQDVCYDKHCFIYIADRDNNRIRKVSVLEGTCNIGIENFAPKALELNIFPNPNSGIVNVQINNATETSSYRIFDLIGAEVKSGTLTYTENKIDVQHLANGMYTLVVSQNGKTSSAKLVCGNR